MGGTLPICPFCRKQCADGGVKDHVRAKHPLQYRPWIIFGQRPYWQYDERGLLRAEWKESACTDRKSSID